MFDSVIKDINAEAKEKAEKELAASKKLESYVGHPFSAASIEDKMLYLQSLAVVMNVDETIDEEEKQYITILINSFELDSNLLETIVEFSNYPDPENVKDFLTKFVNHEILPVFLFDALNMIHRDGVLDETEKTLVTGLCKQLKIDESIEQKVELFFNAINTQNFDQAARYLFLNVLPKDSFAHVFSLYKQDIDSLIADHATIKVGNTEFSMKPIPAGDFMMGNSGDDDNKNQTEKPYHKVTLKAFSMMETLVTFELWEERLKELDVPYKPDDSGWGRGKRPLNNMSWDDINDDFIPWLHRKTGISFRLPTEAEWEYACRAGTTSEHSFGNEVTDVDANFCYIHGRTTEVKSYQANAWGLFDMHGNLQEWCQDVFIDNYSRASTDGTAMTEGIGNRVLRGGSFQCESYSIRSSARSFASASYRGRQCGFRLVNDLSC